MKGNDIVFGRKRRLALLFVAVLFLGTGCARRAEETPTPAVAPVAEGSGATETPFVLPTLYPTSTRPAAPNTATFIPVETETPGPTVDLTQKLVEFRYTIPALNLDRRLEGNVSGAVTVVDETTGLAAILRNRGGVLLELQEALPELELAAVPADCDRCVHFSYSLPLDGLEEDGWLQDPVMLASIDNYLSSQLGPHFPEETVLGLYRSASPYEVAHTFALTAEGTLWRYLATSGEIAEPVSAEDIGGDLRAEVRSIPVDDLAPEYVVTCPGTPVEQLFLDPAAVTETEGDGGAPAPATPGPEQTVEVTIVCPAFSLPTTLLSLYTRVDELLSVAVPDEEVPAPALAIPLETLLAYDRADGARLLLLQSGRAQAVAPGGETYTGTLGLSEVISVTTQLRESEALQPGVEAYAEGVAPNSVLVRGPQGMMEAVWADETPEPLQESVDRFERLLGELIGSEPQGTPTPAASGTITATIRATFTPAATATP